MKNQDCKFNVIIYTINMENELTNNQKSVYLSNKYPEQHCLGFTCKTVIKRPLSGSKEY